MRYYFIKETGGIMTKKDPYNAALKDIRKQMPRHMQIISIVLHYPITEVILQTLEKTFFRLVPSIFGITTAVTVSLFMLSIGYYYGYTIVSISTAAYAYILGYIVGIVFEYIKSLVRQIQ